MYDRTHDALWSQIAFNAISGPDAGRALKHLPWELTTFEQWRAEHPESTVADMAVKAGDKAPDFTLPDGHGRAVSLSEMLGGGTDRRIRAAVVEKGPTRRMEVGDILSALNSLSNRQPEKEED